GLGRGFPQRAAKSGTDQLLTKCLPPCECTSKTKVPYSTREVALAGQHLIGPNPNKRTPHPFDLSPFESTNHNCRFAGHRVGRISGHPVANPRRIDEERNTQTSAESRTANLLDSLGGNPSCRLNCRVRILSTAGLR